MRWLVLAAVAAISIFGASQALSQATVKPCVTTGVNTCPPVSASNPMPISGTVTATAGGTQDTNLTQILGVAAVAGNGTAAGALRVTLPTDGTGVVAATQSGTWTVQPGNTANTSAWLVQLAGQSFVNITTNADTNVKASAGTFIGIVINSIGTTSTAKIFNDADGTCSTGLIATITTVLQNSLTFNAAAGTGICVQTAGAAAADITILYR